MLTGVLRQARRKAAVTAYLEAGWAIAPGAWWDPRPEQYRCRRVGCLTTGTIHASGRDDPRRTDPSAWANDPADHPAHHRPRHRRRRAARWAPRRPRRSSPGRRCRVRSPCGRPRGPACCCSPARRAAAPSPTACPTGCPKAPCCTAPVPTSPSRRPACAPATSCGCGRRRRSTGTCPSWARSWTSWGAAPVPGRRGRPQRGRLQRGRLQRGRLEQRRRSLDRAADRVGGRTGTADPQAAQTGRPSQTEQTEQTARLAHRRRASIRAAAARKA